LHAAFPAHGDVIAQVVEAKLGVGTVGDIGEVSLRAAHWAQQVGLLPQRVLFGIVDVSHLIAIGAGGHLQHAHLEPQQVVDGSHPARVTAGEVVVDRHEVRALALQRVEVERQGGG